MVSIRPLLPEDIPACQQVWDTAFGDLGRRLHLPPWEPTPDMAAAWRARMAHLQRTDPGGAFVAVEGDDVVGVAQALVRDDVWVLSLLGVAPTHQGRGVGHDLLDAALAHGSASRSLILASLDPAAVRRYAFAGFEVHPAVKASGFVRKECLPPVEGVRAGRADDHAWMGELDRKLRGGSHGPDFDLLSALEHRFLCLDESGYAISGERRGVLLAASDEASAETLLAAVLADAPDDGEFEVGWLTAPQQWAIRLCLRAGLRIEPIGSVMLRGFDEPPFPYIPSGAFG